MAEVEFRLLGSVEGAVAGQSVNLGPPRQRAVLAALLLEVGRVVSVDQLIDRVWGEQLPGQPRKVLYSYLSRLRRILSTADVSLPQVAGGYRIDVAPEAVDLHRFDQLLRLARSTTTEADAAAHLQEALGLWRGEPFTGIDAPWFRQEANRLTAVRDTALADLRDLRLQLGEHADLIPELRAALLEQPLDERLARQTMLALYRTGRQAEALDCYQTLRRQLADELGADPDPLTQQLHRQILTSDQALVGPDRPAVAATVSSPPPDTLPWDVKAFTGREAELAQLAALTPTNGHPGTAAAVVVSGGGGVGKTALAVHWAHQDTTRGTFTDGLLYLDLRGFSEHPPLTAADALRSLLRQLGIPGSEIPSDPEHAQRLYRRTLHGRRMLVVLDNAMDSEQVRPLLIAPPSLTLVTSRNRLTGLIVQEGAAEVLLERLPDQDAQLLAGRLLGEQHPSGSALQLSRLCANLPLAIRLAATGYRTAHPDTRLDDYLEQLAGDRIGLLDAATDSSIAITDVLSRSVRRLPPDLVRAFELIGLHPGPRLDIEAVTALLDTTPRHSRRIVRVLTSTSLLEETRPDRWSMHDLLAEYARDRAGSDTEAVYIRLLDHYIERLAADPIDHAWINDERAALLACLQLPVPLAVLERYVATLGDRLHELDLHADSWHTYETLQRRCPAGSPGYALATFGLGRAAVWSCEPAAEQLLNDALASFQRLNDPRGEARTLRELAEWHRGKGQHQSKLDLRALELFQQAGDLAGESDTLMALALEFAASGDQPRAHEYATQALVTARRAGSRRLEGEAHRAMGNTALMVGKHAVAEAHFTQALELFTQVGYPAGRGMCLGGLADVATAAGQHHSAVAHRRQALTIFKELNDHHNQAYSYFQLGRTTLAIGDPEQAREYLNHALHLNQRLGNRAGITFSLMGLADVLLATDQFTKAIGQYQRVAADLADLGYPRGEAGARLGLGRALATTGDHDQARQQLELAATLFERSGSPRAAEARQIMQQLPEPAHLHSPSQM